MTTTDPKSVLPDVVIEETLNRISEKMPAPELKPGYRAPVITEDDDVRALRAHIAALKAKLKATEQTLDSSNQTFRIMVHRLQMQEAENKRLREALVNRFNRDWTNTTEALEQALKETFTAQRSEIMAALAQDGKAGD